ncbi:exonuclease SbcC [Desulfacinum hydrothermale DSM 13146]|uniref:Exonuclease SbcC n=1 Tax=Desulfacinum hydrothermale DSM 13146 TaxID=1121390 RepID=A0A1W1XDC0_9BACT|nr:ATP-binding protein [Desulfacinum hydrothermale]SMC21889.1 exonuclease SbcC [Desulfacinum hydrothermale DSM 13146]
MIRRIVIENFMAHERTELELHRGVNVITGPNNTGKSAVVEALRCVAENPPSREVIRHGASCAVVRLELDDGRYVQWERKANSAIYKIGAADGGEETYAKFGRTVPKDVQAMLRIQSLETEAGAIDIHIGNQKTPIFLLDQSGSQAAAFFAASTEAEYLLQMQQELKTRTGVAQRQVKRLEADLARTEKELERFRDLPRLNGLLEEAQDLYGEIQRLERAIPALESFLRTLEECVTQRKLFLKRHDELGMLQAPPDLNKVEPLRLLVQAVEKRVQLKTRLHKGRDVLRDLPAPPPLKDTAALRHMVASLFRTRGLIGIHREQAKVLEGIGEPPVLRKTPGLESTCRRMRALERDLHRFRERRAALDRLVTPPNLYGTDTLAAALGEMERLTRIRRKVRGASNALSHLSGPPALHPSQRLAQALAALHKARAARDAVAQKGKHLARLQAPPEKAPVAALASLCRRLEALKAKSDRWERGRRRLEEALCERRDQVRDWIDRAGLCPFCRQPMDVDHFLEEAAADKPAERERHDHSP